MSEFFPPLVMELKGKAGQLLTTLKGVQAEVAKTEKATDKATTGVEHNMRLWQSVGKYVTIGVAGAAVAVGGYSLKMASDFQSHMTLLQTAGGETGKNMKTVSDGILGLAQSTGTSIDQLSEGMYTVEKSGNRGAAGLMILKAAAQGAKAENVDLGTATNALTSVMMSYHLKAKDAISVQNQMVAGAGMAKTTMAEYAGSLSTVIPVASAAHIGFDQVAGAIATLTQHGTSSQEATQELANTIRNLQAPSQVAQKAMQQIGLSVNDVSSKVGQRGLTGTIDLISGAISKKMGPSGLVFVDAMKKSQSASQDMQTMLKQMPKGLADLSQKFMDGKIGMKEYQTAFKGMGGSSYAMGAQFLGLSKQTQGFNNLLSSGQPGAQTFSKYLKDIMGGATGMNTALMLGGDNMGYFKKATDDVSTAGKHAGANISTWAKTQQTFAVQMAQARETIQVLAVKIGTVLMPVVSGAVKGFSTFVTGLEKGKPAAVALGVVIATVLVAAMAAYVSHLAVAAVKSVKDFLSMTAAGIRWVATQIANFASLIVKGAVWLATSTAQFVSWVAKQAASTAESVAIWLMYKAQWISQQVASAAESLAIQSMYLGQWIAKQSAALAKSLAAGASYAARWIQQAVVSSAKWVAAQSVAFAQATAKGAAWLAAQTVQLAVSGAKWVASTAVTIASLVAQNAAMIAQKAVMIGGAVAMGIVTAAQWAWNVAMDANPIGLIILAIAALVATIIFLVTHWKQVTQFLTDTWKNIGNFFVTVGNAIASWWNGFWKGIANWVMQTFGPLINWVRTMWAALGVGIQAVGNAIQGWWNGFWGAIGSFAQSVFSGYINWLQSVWGGIAGFFQSVGNAISAAWNGLWSGLGDVVRSAFDGVVGFIRGAMNGVIDVINGVIGSINGALSAGKAIGINVSLPTVPHFESGGTMPYSGYALVGEAGPELVQLPAGARVFPNGSTQTQSAMQQAPSSSGSQVTNNITVQAQTNASPNQIATTVGWELRLLG